MIGFVCADKRIDKSSMMISEQHALKGKMPKANSEYCFK
jgi:hypothetical protein